jgi:hypothetical protein
MHGPTGIFRANLTHFSLQITEPFVERMWRNAYIPAGVDVCAKAGSAVLVNNSNIHAGTVRLAMGVKVIQTPLSIFD